ncbi:MAG: substrate-binding domain-containing protein [Rhodobacteraceae bacterium]|nr:substrate-binding domain-containing protein [Paracoccaceae bacterium]
MNLKELAAELGLSQTTVSRALNGYPEVSEATRERVEAAARRHNYFPNARARSLATGRTHAIGHVLPGSTKHEILNPIFGDFIAGASEEYSRAGYELMLSVVRDEDEANAYRELVAKGTVDGIIVHSPKENDERIPLLKDIGIPFVVHGRSTEADTDYSWVDVNSRRAFHQATRLLLDLGHRRIGLVNGLETGDFAIRRRDGYLSALEEAGVARDGDLMTSSEMTETHGHEAACAMLNLPSPATAFICSSMIMAIGVRRAIHDKGLEMGRDVSVITYDDDLAYLRNGTTAPIFTAIRSSVRTAGRQAAEILTSHIADPSLPPQHRLLEAELLLGDSTGPLRGQET